MLSAVAVPLSLNFAHSLGLVNRRLLDVLYENVNIVSGEELLRVNRTEIIRIYSDWHSLQGVPVCATSHFG